MSLVAVALVLGACQQGFEAAGRKVDAPGVPVALVGVEGGPETVQAQVTDAVATQAAARHIEIVGSAESPKYRLKGYLTAYASSGDETTLAFVWDVFDASSRRAQRISTTATARGRAADPWTQVGEQQIQAVAARSMNEVAAFLAGSGTGQAGVPAGAAPALALSGQ